MTELRLDRPALFEVVVNAAPMALVLMDGGGEIVLANPAFERLFGYERRELEGKRQDVLFASASRSTFTLFHARLASAAKNEKASLNVRCAHRQGRELELCFAYETVDANEERWVLYSASERTPATAVGAGSGPAIANVEPLTAPPGRRHQSLHALGSLTAEVARDFDAVLSAIVSLTESARSHAQQPVEIEQDLAKVLGCAEQAQLLVRRLLTFSRGDDVRCARVRLEAPVEDACQELRTALPGQVELRQSLDSAVPRVSLDPALIRQLVMNLGRNALHALAEHGGTMEIQVAPFYAAEAFVRLHAEFRVGLYARLSVKDGGGGMPARVRERAFEPYFTTKVPGSGSGLGLSVVHGIVQSAGGVIELRSEPGRGTAVDIYLPAVAQEEDDEDRASDSKPPHSSGLRILLVDDEETLVRSGRRTLERLGHQVSAFAGSLAALVEFRAHPRNYDLVLSDLTMPHLSGVDLAREVNRLRPDIPVLLLTGYGASLSPETLRRAGVHAVLEKPVTGQAIDEAVRSAAESRLESGKYAVAARPPARVSTQETSTIRAAARRR